MEPRRRQVLTVLKYASRADGASPSLTSWKAALLQPEGPDPIPKFYPRHVLPLLAFILSISLKYTTYGSMLNLFLKPTWIFFPQGGIQLFIVVIDVLILPVTMS